MERDKLKKFCDEFVYGEENPQYYKTMDEKIESLKKELHNERISRVNSDAFYENIIAEKIESLKSDLDWATQKLEIVFLIGADKNRLKDRNKEIRQRHNLYKNEGVK